MKRALILGGYGNFGKRISEALVRSGIPVIVAGRNLSKATALCSDIETRNPNCEAIPAVVDVNDGLADQLRRLNPGVVINTAGPFQNADYSVAQTCVESKIHAIDIADGRDFVVGISRLNEAAKAAGVAVVSGASTVPGLSSAVLGAYADKFETIESLTYGISPGQKAERGLATTAGILSYIGKPLKPSSGSVEPHYGWQDIYRQEYPELGKRWMANCDIPDIDILPEKYGIENIRFSAGMESGFLHLGIWVTSWLVRLGLPIKLQNHAPILLRLSHLFDFLGSSDGGMHMIIEGKDADGNDHQVKWFIIAKNGDGPHIPTIPAIVLAKKLIRGELSFRGASACVGLVSLEEYLRELEGFDISVFSK